MSWLDDLFTSAPQATGAQADPTGSFFNSNNIGLFGATLAQAAAALQGRSSDAIAQQMQLNNQLQMQRAYPQLISQMFAQPTAGTPNQISVTPKLQPGQTVDPNNPVYSQPAWATQPTPGGPLASSPSLAPLFKAMPASAGIPELASMASPQNQLAMADSRVGLIQKVQQMQLARIAYNQPPLSQQDLTSMGIPPDIANAATSMITSMGPTASPASPAPVNPSSAAPAAAPNIPAVTRAIVGGEWSPKGPYVVTDSKGVQHFGPGQMTLDMFNKYKATPNANIMNPSDNMAATQNAVTDYMGKFNNDPRRVAVAWLSGPGNVNPQGDGRPWIRDIVDQKTGDRTSAYVNRFEKRMGLPALDASGQPVQPQATGQAAPQATAQAAPDSEWRSPFGQTADQVRRLAAMGVISPETVKLYSDESRTVTPQEAAAAHALPNSQIHPFTGQITPGSQFNMAASSTDPQIKLLGGMIAQGIPIQNRAVTPSTFGAALTVAHDQLAAAGVPEDQIIDKLGKAQIAFKANQAAATTVAKGQAQTAINESTVEGNMKIVQGLLAKGAAGPSKITGINDLIQWSRRNTNNPDAVNLANAMVTLSNDYATVMGNGGKTTDALRDTAAKLLANGYNAGTINAVMGQMHYEMRTRSGSYTAAMNQLTGRPGVQPTTTPSPAPSPQTLPRKAASNVIKYDAQGNRVQ